MISLPKPYEDELLYSVVARAIAYLAPKHDFAVNRLIGRAQCSIFFGLPIDWLDGGIESAWRFVSARDRGTTHNVPVLRPLPSANLVLCRYGNNAIRQ